MKRPIFTWEHNEFRTTVREFLAREVLPHHARWEEEGRVDKSVYAAAAKAGVLGFGVPEEYGGLGIDDFRFNAVVGEEMSAGRFHGPAFTLHNDVIIPYMLRMTTDEQKQRWLPGLATGQLTFALALTEPNAGSDLAGIKASARRSGDAWVVNGQKTFITNGILSDVVIVAVRTSAEDRHKAISLLVVEDGMEGFVRGRALKKIGNHAQDTAELFFTDVVVPESNLLGQEGRGFYHLMENLPSERLSIAVGAVANAREILAETLEYVKERRAFGQPVGSFQANRFTLAEIATELDIAQVYIDNCISRLLDGEFSAIDAAKAKWWATELNKRVVDRCLQLYGGYGYMTEYKVARAYQDVRVHTILGGTTEIMKEIISKDLGL